MADLRKWVIGLSILALLLVAVALSIWLTPLALLWQTVGGARADLEQAGVPTRLAFAIVLVLGLPFILASMRLMSKKNLPFLDRAWPPTKFQAFLIVVLWAGGFSSLLYALTRDQLAGRYYCPKELEVFERPGLCPADNVALLPMNAEITGVIQKKRQGKDVTPKELSQLSEDGPFFNARSPEDHPLAIVYFGRDLEGRLHPYSFPGVNPLTGAPLEAATISLVKEWRAVREQEQRTQDSVAAIERARAEQEALVRQRRLKAAERLAAQANPGIRTGYESRSTESLRQLVPTEPDNALLHYELGRRDWASGDREGAIRSFREALRANPTFQEARVMLQNVGGTP